ncbi:MAG TPA: CAP domain-containing protein [Solirubrobacteraceae bacterium]|nr:CAP domain-containing protein [Solirubrobacteraceae bacterium]
MTILTPMPSPRERSSSVSAGRNRWSRIAIAVVTLFSSALLAAIPSASASAATQRHHRRARTASGCANANANVAHTSDQALRAAVVCLINQQRASHHLPALRASHLLDRSAQGWTNAMVSSDVFSHGINFAGRISAAGYVWRAAGENIATGFQTPAGVVRAWMASTGHCQNILNPTYGNVGTGVSRRAVSGWASGAGTWTQDFALSMYQSPPSANWGPADGCPY